MNWSPWHIPFLAAVVAEAAAGLFVLRGAGRRAQGRRLAAVLFIESAFFIVITVMSASEDLAATGLVLRWPFMAALFLEGAAFALFLSTLDTPLVRPLRSRAGTSVILAWPVAHAAWMLAAPDAFLAEFTPDDATEGAGYWSVTATLITLFLFAFAAGVSQYRGARGLVARRRAGAYLAAFGIRDLGYAGILIVDSVFPVPPGGDPGFVRSFLDSAGMPLAAVLFAGLLTCGILRTQLFDIDVKIKWTIRRGTVAAVFVAVFVGAAAAAEQLLQRYGVLFGAIAAGLLVFAIHPLQRFADRVADTAMPGVKPVGQMSLDERRALYTDQARLAWADGALSMDERQLLEGLRGRLGISAEEAAALERDAARPTA